MAIKPTAGSAWGSEVQAPAHPGQLQEEPGHPDVLRLLLGRRRHHLGGHPPPQITAQHPASPTLDPRHPTRRRDDLRDSRQPEQPRRHHRSRHGARRTTSSCASRPPTAPGPIRSRRTSARSRSSCSPTPIIATTGRSPGRCTPTYAGATRIPGTPKFLSCSARSGQRCEGRSRSAGACRGRPERRSPRSSGQPRQFHQGSSRVPSNVPVSAPAQHLGSAHRRSRPVDLALGPRECLQSELQSCKNLEKRAKVSGHGTRTPSTASWPTW